MAASLHPGAVWGLLKEAKAVTAEQRPLQVSGLLATQLVKELARGGSADAVREGGDVAGAEALVHVLAGEPPDADRALLRAASRAAVPIVAVQTGPEELWDVPYVLATDVVFCPPGKGFPVERIAGVLAARLGERGTSLAARLPVLREPVCRELIRDCSRQNGIIGAAIFVPGADLPVLTLNQVRLVLRLAAAHGVEIDQKRLPEVLAVIGSGFGFRLLARQALGVVPVAGWALKGALAYAGTRALGEAALRYFATTAQRTSVTSGNR